MVFLISVKLSRKALVGELIMSLVMRKLQRAREIHREDGIYTLISKSSNFLRRKIHNQFWPRHYSIKSSVLGNHIVNVNNVLIDLDDEVFSPAMKKRLRSKRYEHAERNLINTHIHSNHPTIDLGAGVGYTACLIDREADDSTPVVAIEANKSLIPVIKRTKNLNKSSFNILYSAYDSSDSSVEFQVAEDFWSSSQYNREDRKQNKITVPSVSLNDVIEKYNLEKPIQLVVDIEGGEHDLFVNEYNLLQSSISLIIFEYHSFTENKFEYYKEILVENGFEFVESQGNVYVFQNTNL